MATIIKLIFSSLLLFWITRNIDFSEILDIILGANLWLIALAFLMFFLGYFISASRWKLLLSAQGVSAQLKFLVESFMVAIFFNNLLPSTIGGDFIRMYDSWRLGNSKSNAASVIIVDRLMGLLALVSYALVSIIFAAELSSSITSLPSIIMALSLIFFLLAWFIFLAPKKIYTTLSDLQIFKYIKINDLIKKIAIPFSDFSGRRDLLLRAFGLSLLLQLNVIIHFIILTEALDVSIPPLAMFTIIPLSIFVTMIPISINGIGVRESIFVFFFSAYGVSATQAIAFAWVSLALIILQGLIGGLVFTFRKEKLKLS